MKNRFISPDQVFFNNTTGDPLSLGRVYFGEPNQDPKTNPKAPYSDIELSTAISPTQTLTAAGKFASDIYLNGLYSIVVEDGAGNQMFSAAEVSGFGSGEQYYTVPSMADLLQSSGLSGGFDQVFIASYYPTTYPSATGPKGAHLRHRTATTGTPSTISGGYAYDADGVGWLISSNPVTIDMFGAIPDAATDSYQAITTALSVSDHVIIPNTDSYYAMGDGTIEIIANKVLEFQGRARLIRTTALSSDQSPVVWLSGNRATIKGQSKISGITSQSPTPDGVILVGAEDMSTASGNVYHWQIDGIRVDGHANQGNSSGTATHAIKVNAPQVDGEAVYFGHINNVYLANANYGISLNGWANATRINNIFGEQTGNEYSGIGGALIWLNGAQETSISGVFHHTAAGSVALKMSTYDNTAVSSGLNYIPQFTSARGVIAEAGTNSRLIKMVGTGMANNYFEIRKNAPLSNELSADFYTQNNTLIDTGVYSRTVHAGELLRSDVETRLNGAVWHQGATKTVANAASVDFDFVAGHNGAISLLVSAGIGANVSTYSLLLGSAGFGPSASMVTTLIHDGSQGGTQISAANFSVSAPDSTTIRLTYSNSTASNTTEHNVSVHLVSATKPYVME